jgi:hypothetical protein
MKVGEQVGDVSRATVRLVARGGDGGLALAARIEGDDVIATAERDDLRRPDPGGHGPAGD